jgi:hypothetical protein
MSQTIESDIQDEDVDEAVETEKELTQDIDEINMYSLSHENGFIETRGRKPIPSGMG